MYSKRINKREKTRQRQREGLGDKFPWGRLKKRDKRFILESTEGRGFPVF